MRTHTITSVILSLFCIAAFAQESPSAYGAAYAAWEARPTDRASASESVAAFDKLRVAWSNASTFERDHAAYYFALAAVTTAANAPSEEAGRLLGVAAKVAAEYPIVISRGKSPKRFEQVASVHARVWGANKVDPFAGAPIGYEMAPRGGGFVALQESAEVDQTVAVDAGSVLGDKEGIGLLLDLDSTGSVVEALPIAIAAGTGSIRSRVKAILKHEPAGPNGPGRFERQEPEVFFSAHPTTTTTPTLAPPSPTLHQSARQIKAPSSAPAPPPIEGPTSSTPWSIIVVLIVAGVALLWLVLKRRS
jgi:hypothetical protein